MIDANRFPIVSGRFQPGQEYPAGSLDVEARILFQPMPDVALRPSAYGGEAGHPPAVDLQRPEIMAAVTTECMTA